MNVSFLQELLNAVAERGRSLLPRALVGAEPVQEIAELAGALVSGRGEASGVVLAREILAKYRELGAAERRVFFGFLEQRLGPDYDQVRLAAAAFLAAPGPDAYARLASAVEPRRQEFFRRLNLAPGATAEIVRLRLDLLQAMVAHPALAQVDADLMHLLGSWFNRGFLVLRRIDWSTPANILEKIIAYEAVHEIQGWDDLRRRLDPQDRRCFAFFHPSLVDEPLIFVEVALTREIPGSIQELLHQEAVFNDPKGASKAGSPPTTAVFYSISNCQDGLRGISFGNFLIKQVVDDLARELPSLKTFVTLSPVPGFRRWLDRVLAGDLAGEAAAMVTPAQRVALQILKDPNWLDDTSGDDDEDHGNHAEAQARTTLLALAAHYFLLAKQREGRPVDPVARFHLGNGARLERINWRGDISDKGLREAYGLMVNYLYDLREIERNHEAYANDGTVTASRAVRSLLKVPDKPRAGKDKPEKARPAVIAPKARAAPAPGGMSAPQMKALPPPKPNPLPAAPAGSHPDSTDTTASSARKPPPAASPKAGSKAGG